MFSNRIALAAIAAACVGAAGAGGYLATRHNVASMAAPDAAAAGLNAPTPLPVQETEAIVSAPAKPAEAAGLTPTATSPAVATSAPAKRATPGAQARSSSQAPAAASTAKPADPPSLDRTWPSGASSAPPSNATSPQTDTQATPLPAHAEENTQEVTRAPEAPARKFEELVIAADSVVGLQTDTALSSERSRVEDRVEAHVVRDVRVGGEVAIPAGTKALGTVVVVDRGGKFKERARLGIRFQTLVLADGTRLPITTETIYRYGNSPTNASAAKIGGGAVVGAIIGGIIGGGKGAAIGATTGAGAGTATVMAGDRDVAVFPAGAEVTARITAPATVTVEHE